MYNFNIVYKIDNFIKVISQHITRLNIFVKNIKQRISKIQRYRQKQYTYCNCIY